MAQLLSRLSQGNALLAVAAGLGVVTALLVVPMAFLGPADPAGLHEMCAHEEIHPAVHGGRNLGRRNPRYRNPGRRNPLRPGGPHRAVHCVSAAVMGRRAPLGRVHRSFAAECRRGRVTRTGPF